MKIRIDQIVPDPEAFRKDQGDISRLAEDIKLNGLIHPVALNQNLRILAGRRRLAAVIQLGWTEVESNIIETSGDLGDRMIELSENLERKDLSWQEECELKAAIDKLQKQIHGDAEATGNRTNWSTRKTAELLGESDSNTQRDVLLAEAFELIPELKNCGSKAEAQKTFKKMVEQAAIQEIKNRATAQQKEETPDDESKVVARAEASYINSDAIEGMQSLQPGGFVLAEVDPPYGINLHDLRQTKVDESYQEVEAEDYEQFVGLVATEVYRLLDKNAWCVWWFGMSHYATVLSVLRAVGFDVDEIPCLWTKPVGQTNQPDRRFARAWEGFFLCRKGNPVMHKRGRINVFSYAGVSSEKRIHPTERPLDLIAEIIGTLCVPGTGKVLVPFLGSGNTIRAAMACGLPAIGWDICDASIKASFVHRILEDYRALKKDAEKK